MFKNNMLGASSLNLAHQTVHKYEAILQLARQLRKAIYALPTDLLLGTQVRDI